MTSSNFLFLHEASFHLRASLFYLSCATTLIVFILLIAALITFHKPKSNFGLEIVWSVIPFVMLFVMLVPIINIFIYR